VNVENNFLQKPFTLKQLASKIRAVLDRGSNSVPNIAGEAMEPPCNLPWDPTELAILQSKTVAAPGHGVTAQAHNPNCDCN
jgi:hypothetical protein